MILKMFAASVPRKLSIFGLLPNVSNECFQIPKCFRKVSECSDAAKQIVPFPKIPLTFCEDVEWDGFTGISQKKIDL